MRAGHEYADGDRQTRAMTQSAHRGQRPTQAGAGLVSVAAGGDFPRAAAGRGRAARASGASVLATPLRKPIKPSRDEQSPRRSELVFQVLAEDRL